MKKSQMEILGLVIVILLILLGLLLFISFSLKENPSANLQTDFQNNQITKNYLNAYLYVTTSCNNLQINSLAKECAAIKGGIPIGSNVICKHGNPCDEMQAIARNTSEQVFAGYNYRISFGIIRGGIETEIFNVTSLEYKFDEGDRPGSATQPLPSKVPGQTLHFRVDLSE